MKDQDTYGHIIDYMYNGIKQNIRSNDDIWFIFEATISQIEKTLLKLDHDVVLYYSFDPSEMYDGEVHIKYFYDDDYDKWTKQVSVLVESNV
jgi:hypothetical protein